MRKKVNHIVHIAGRSFEVNDNNTIYAPYDEVRIRTPWNYNTIYDAYDNPSDTKVEEWEDWNTWFIDNFDTSEWCVGSRNVYQFSIIAKVITNDRTEAWYLYITRDHNRAYRIANE